MSPDNYDVVGEYSNDLNEFIVPKPEVQILDLEWKEPFGQIEKIIKNFDFRKCNRICKLLRWKYDFHEKTQRIPNELELRNIARSLMHEVITDTRFFMETKVAQDYCFVATYNGVIVKLYYVMVSA